MSAPSVALYRDSLDYFPLTHRLIDIQKVFN